MLSISVLAATLLLIGHLPVLQVVAREQSGAKFQILLNSCFEFWPNHRVLHLHEDSVTGTNSVQFKDDCLRACLITMIRETFTCRSLVHMPQDNDCVLTTMDSKHAKLERVVDPDLNLLATNYYANKCAKPSLKDSRQMEAKLIGFSGGEGVLRVAHSRNEGRTEYMIVLDGMQEHNALNVYYRPQITSDCYRRMTLQDMENLRKLESNLEVDPSTGMAIVPWKGVELALPPGRQLFNATISVVDPASNAVILCGSFQPITERNGTEQHQTHEETLLIKKSNDTSPISFNPPLFILLLLLTVLAVMLA